MITRRSDMNYVEGMDPEEALAFILFLRDKDIEDKLFQRWCAGPQFEISFEEFKTKLKPVPIVPDEIILEDVYDIIRSIGGEFDGNI